MKHPILVRTNAMAKRKKLSGVEQISKERMRQISDEGWTGEHDSNHCDDELAWAAACYAAPEPIYEKIGKRSIYVDIGKGVTMTVEGVVDDFVDPWPWDDEFDKRNKHDRKRKLVIAGALIAAEIDRLQS